MSHSQFFHDHLGIQSLYFHDLIYSPIFDVLYMLIILKFLPLVKTLLLRFFLRTLHFFHCLLTISFQIDNRLLILKIFKALLLIFPSQISPPMTFYISVHCNSVHPAVFACMHVCTHPYTHPHPHNIGIIHDSSLTQNISSFNFKIYLESVSHHHHEYHSSLELL